MLDRLYLSWNYIRYHWPTAMVLTFALTLIFYLPISIQILVEQADRHFRSRSESTPLIVGPKGSPLELVLNSIYFGQPQKNYLEWNEFDRVREQKLGICLPVHSRFEVRGFSIVGTTPDYFSVRDIAVSDGKLWRRPGQCVIGFEAAQKLKLRVDDSLVSSSSTAFVLDSPPLQLSVAGILEPTGTPDDNAIFTNMDTVWIMEGLGHGHAPTAVHGTSQPFTVITDENLKTFHFHGNPNRFPISSILIFPDDQRASTLLRSQYLSADNLAQIVVPDEIMASLFERILSIRTYVFAIIGLLTFVTLLLIVSIIVISIRMQCRELLTLSRMGASRSAVLQILSFQILLLLGFALVSASALVSLTTLFSNNFIEFLVSSFG